MRSVHGFVFAMTLLTAVSALWAGRLSAQPIGDTPAKPAIPTTAPTTAPALGLIAPELKGRKVEDVRVLGNKTVSTLVISNLIRVRAGDAFDPVTIEEDYQRVYGLRKFSNVQARVEPTANGGVNVIFEVTEQTTLQEIRFTGNIILDDLALRDLVDIKPGQSVDPYRISVAKQSIVRLYQEKNFPKAHVSVADELLTQKGILEFQIVAGPRVEIRKISLEGNQSFSSEKVLDQVKSHTYVWILNGGRYDEELVEDDVAAIRQFYVSHGFFDVRVGRKLVVSPDQKEIALIFLVDEGTRYKVGSVSFKGLVAFKEETIRVSLKLVQGRDFDQEMLQRDVRTIVKAYSASGGYIYLPRSNNPDYLTIDTKQIFHRETGKVDLVHEIHEGNKFRVGRIMVRGNTRVQDKVILREMRVVPGQQYNASEFQDAIERLRGTQVITGAQITPIGDHPDTRDVLVEIKEGQTAFFTLGAGLSSNSGIIGNFSYDQKNFDYSNVPGSWGELFSTSAFTGAGQKLKIQLEPGTQQTRASVSFLEPYLFDQPYSLGVNLNFLDWIRERYSEVRAGGSISIGKRFNNQWSGRISLRGEDINIRAIEDYPLRAPEVIGNKGHHTLSSIGFDIRRDTTDSSILATRGSVFNLNYEHVGAFGGSYDYDKLQGDASYFLTLKEDILDRKTILALRGHAGWISGNAPFFEQFYGGGTGSLRGFRFRGVSPRSGPENDPVGGKFALTGTAEVSFPLAGEGLRGVLFVDAGTVERNVTITTIRSSVGFGFRFNLPLFGQVPIAVDFGIPVTKDRLDDKQIFSFSLGVSQ